MSSATIVAALLWLSFMSLPEVAAEGNDVVWTDLVNATVTGTVLQKPTPGINQWDLSGAASEQTLSAGDGYIEFTVGETDTLWTAGLSHGNDDATYTDIDFAFHFNGTTTASVLENGVYQNGGDTPLRRGTYSESPSWAAGSNTAARGASSSRAPRCRNTRCCSTCRSTASAPQFATRCWS